MADETHTQVLVQQQPSASQQAQMQQSQIQQSQLQQSQLQQQQQHQQQQQQHHHHQQQQQQQQQQSMSQQSQQQSVAATMSLGSNEQNNHMNVTTSLPISVATINVSQPQQMQTLQQNVNTSSGTPVQMAVPQLTAQAQTIPAGTMISQSSGPHPTMIHPTMTVSQSPLQQVQVIQQPLSASYLQQLYTPQQQMLFPGNLTLQHAGMATPLQSLGATQGLSLQLQAKPAMDQKNSVGAQALQAVNAANKNIAVNAGTMMTASGQVIGTAAPKTNFSQQMMAAPGKSAIIHSQGGFAPSNANQTVVIGQLGMLPNQQSIYNHKALADSQKGKTFTFQNQPATLQPKSLYSSTVPVHSTAQVFNGSQLKQIGSQPQIITSQAPGTMLSQAQILALNASIPQGISWATPGSFQSSTLFAQNPIIIRSQQSDMFIQSPPQSAVHLPVAAATAPVPPTTFAATPLAPQKPKQVRVRPGTQTVAVATQTIVSNALSINSNSAPIRTPIKPKGRPTGSSLGASPSPAPQMATTQTQTSQSHAQTSPPTTQQKSDAANQTQSNQVKVQTSELKSPQNKSVEVKQSPSPSIPLPVKSQAVVAPSTKIVQTTVSPTVAIAVTTGTSSTITTSTSTPVVTTSAVYATTSVVPVMNNAAVSTSPVPPTELDSVSEIDTVVPLLNEESKPIPVPDTEVSKLISVPEIELSKPLSVPVTEVVMPVSLPEVEVSLPIPTPVEPIKPVTPQQSEPVNKENDELIKPQTVVKPSISTVKEKQPQKAIVKPQVLTHVIDGFVIQEGPEPFPVSRSSLLSDSPYRIMPPDKEKQTEDTMPAPSPEKKMKMHKTQGNVELAKCEFCGKVGPKSKFKRSKRFCSTSCAKRYNVCCSNRVGLVRSAVQENVASGPGRRRKMGFRGRRGLRKQSHLENQIDIRNETEVVDVTMEESGLNVKTVEENSEIVVDDPQPVEIKSEQEDVIVMNNEPVVPRKLPDKWTVQEVFEFIRDLPGCSDYADVFRSQEIDGQALLLLKEDHLMTAMCMKLGPALKLISHINTIKEEISHS